ncbi:MAG: thioredoxin family protein [Candidatus Lokiarchaeota archaeon]
MSITNREEKIIKNEMSKLRDKVTVKIFTDYKINDGKKTRRCMACNTAINILDTLAKFSDGKFEFEEISTELDEQISEKYKIKRIPTILFLNKNDKEIIRYSAIPDGNELVPFIRSIQYYSGVSPFYKDQVKTNLKNISNSDIKLFVTQTCPYCPQVLPIVTLFAIVSNGKIKSEIIDINANQDVAAEYQISGVPHTLINEKEHLYGMFNPQDLLEKLTKGKRDLGGMYA